MKGLQNHPFAILMEGLDLGKEKQWMKPLKDRLMGKTALQGPHCHRRTTDQSCYHWKGDDPTCCVSC